MKFLFLALVLFFQSQHLSFADMPNEGGGSGCETYEEDCERPRGNEEDEPQRPDDGGPDSDDDGGYSFRHY